VLLRAAAPTSRGARAYVHRLPSFPPLRIVIPIIIEIVIMTAIGQVFAHAMKDGAFQLSLLPVRTASALCLGTCATRQPDVGTVRENRAFVPLVQRILAPVCHRDPGLMASATAVGEGFLHLVDERAPLVYGRTAEPEDILLSVRADGGRIVEGSAQAAMAYRPWTLHGPMTLSPFLHARLLEGLHEMNGQTPQSQL